MEYSALLQRLLAQNDDADPITRCGPSVRVLLERSFTKLQSTPDAANAPADAFRTLLHLADEKINTLPFHAVGAEWLRLYVDATIGLILSDISHHHHHQAAAPGWRAWIRKLDMAIIVAGAVGPGRDETIHRLISLIQEEFAPHLLETYRALAAGAGRPSKRQRVGSPTSRARGIHYAPSPIPEISPPPSTSRYRAHSARPFIVRAFAGAHCPALVRWGCAAYLLAAVGPGRVVPVEVGASYTSDGWGQRIVGFEWFLARVGYDLHALPSLDEDDEEEETPKGPLYLAQHALLEQFPALRADVYPLPDYVYSCPHAPDYAPPGNEEALILNVWVGSGASTPPSANGENAGPVVSPAHTDPYFNCYLQILGRKRVWLAPPIVSDSMYAFPGAGTSHDGDTDDGSDDTDGDGDGLVTSYTTNTSRVPIFENPDRSRGPAYERRFSRFYERAFPESMEAVLEPGDLLVMPPKWWHAMRSEGDGVAWSLSMWY